MTRQIMDLYKETIISLVDGESINEDKAKSLVLEINKMIDSNTVKSQPIDQLEQQKTDLEFILNISHGQS